jgi:hypothetical protein
MRIGTIAVTIALLLLPGTTSTSTAQAPKTGQAGFRVSSEGSPFALTANVKGEWTAREDRLDVDVASMTFRLRPTPGKQFYNGRRRLDAFWASLATTTADGTWRNIRHSERLEIRQVLKPNDKLKLEGLRLSIPIQEGDRLDTMRLVFTMEEVLLDSEHGEVTGYSYAPSHWDIFRRLRK